MSTRSNIVVEHQDGSFDMIYCHWDGYPSGNGRILLESYRDPKKIAKLLALGDLSSLGPEIGVKHSFEWRTDAYEKGFKHSPYPEPYASYDQMCLAYGRDRGEKGTKRKHFKSGEEMAAFVEDSWTEWVYVFRAAEGKWYYTNNPTPTWFKNCGTEQRMLEELTLEACQEKAQHG